MAQIDELMKHGGVLREASQVDWHVDWWTAMSADADSDVAANLNKLRVRR